jgi:hypothetical protein
MMHRGAFIHMAAALALAGVEPPAPAKRRSWDTEPDNLGEPDTVRKDRIERRRALVAARNAEALEVARDRRARKNAKRLANIK